MQSHRAGEWWRQDQTHTCLNLESSFNRIVCYTGKTDAQADCVYLATYITLCAFHVSTKFARLGTLRKSWKAVNVFYFSQYL